MYALQRSSVNRRTDGHEVDEAERDADGGADRQAELARRSP